MQYTAVPRMDGAGQLIYTPSDRQPPEKVCVLLSDLCFAEAAELTPGFLGSCYWDVPE
jgi:hypothetical protein